MSSGSRVCSSGGACRGNARSAGAEGVSLVVEEGVGVLALVATRSSCEQRRLEMSLPCLDQSG